MIHNYLFIQTVVQQTNTIKCIFQEINKNSNNDFFKVKKELSTTFSKMYKRDYRNSLT